MEFILDFIRYCLRRVSTPTYPQCEAAEPWQLGFQDPATPIMEGIVNLHHDIMFVIVVIGVFVGYLMIRAVQLVQQRRSP